MMDSFQLVTRGLAQRLGLDASSITADDELATLGIDSLDAAELLMELEDKLGIEIESTKQLKTVGDIVAAIDEITE
ncbi:MAG: phosphopantetheine-binding protein [Thermoguttaceae bacterium]|jgi:acyl carrier protein